MYLQEEDTIWRTIKINRQGLLHNVTMPRTGKPSAGRISNIPKYITKFYEQDFSRLGMPAQDVS